MECSCTAVPGEAVQDGPERYIEIPAANRSSPVLLYQRMCGECGEPIPEGYPYTIELIQWPAYFEHDSTLHRYITCRTCMIIREHFFPEAFFFGEIWSDLEDHIWAVRGEIPEECIAALPAKARNWVCERIEEVWNHYY